MNRTFVLPTCSLMIIMQTICDTSNRTKPQSIVTQTCDKPQPQFWAASGHASPQGRLCRDGLQQHKTDVRTDLPHDFCYSLLRPQGALLISSLQAAERCCIHISLFHCQAANWNLKTFISHFPWTCMVDSCHRKARTLTNETWQVSLRNPPGFLHSAACSVRDNHLQGQQKRCASASEGLSGLKQTDL